MKGVQETLKNRKLVGLRWRFDVRSKGKKGAKEDFSSLPNRRRAAPGAINKEKKGSWF